MLLIWTKAKIAFIVLITIFSLFKKEATSKLGNSDLTTVYNK